MAFDSDQRAIVYWSAAALLLTALVVVAGYYWLRPGLLGLSEAMPAADRIAFALKWDLPIFLWLAVCVRRVASQRFREPADRRGAAYGEPTQELAVRAAILQNSLEQTVLVVGAHLILATVLRGREMYIIPLLVVLYLVGRIAFAMGYTKGAAVRSFGMSLTGATAIAGYGIALALIMAGR